MHRYTNSDLRRHPAWDNMLGLMPPDDFVSNGVTCGPDVFLGRDLRPAAHWHDYSYTLAGNEKSRYWDDVEFTENLQRCGLTGWLAPLRWHMYFRVRLWGHWHYTYAHGHEPNRTLRFWWRLLTGRYLQW